MQKWHAHARQQFARDGARFAVLLAAFIADAFIVGRSLGRFKQADAEPEDAQAPAAFAELQSNATVSLRHVASSARDWSGHGAASTLVELVSIALCLDNLKCGSSRDSRSMYLLAHTVQ